MKIDRASRIGRIRFGINPRTCKTVAVFDTGTELFWIDNFHSAPESLANRTSLVIGIEVVWERGDFVRLDIQSDDGMLVDRDRK